MVTDISLVDVHVEEGNLGYGHKFSLWQNVIQYITRSVSCILDVMQCPFTIFDISCFTHSVGSIRNYIIIEIEFHVICRKELVN